MLKLIMLKILYDKRVIPILLIVINGNAFDVMTNINGSTNVNKNAIIRKYLVVDISLVICLNIGTEMYKPTIIYKNQKWYGPFRKYSMSLVMSWLLSVIYWIDV